MRFWLRPLKTPRYGWQFGQRFELLKPVEGFVEIDGVGFKLGPCELSDALRQADEIARQCQIELPDPVTLKPRYGRKHKRRPRPGQLEIQMPVQMTVYDCIAEVQRERAAR